MTNEIDALMDLDPLELSSQDIDAIIAYHRKHRALVQSGIKPKKEGVKTDISTVVQALVQQAPPMRRRS